ncbi:MAG: tetratricopeptide repeat protein, partial [Opitutales bacterium]
KQAKPGAENNKPKKGKKKQNAPSQPGAHLEEARFYLARCLLELEDYKKADQRFAELAPGESLIAAKANLWWARVYTRRKDNYDRAAQILGDYIKRLGNKAKNSPIIDDLQFDYANALIGSKEPSWKNAADALGKVEGRGKFGQMEEVVAQRATCLHKIKDYSNSLNSANSFLTRFKTHSLAGDCRFLRGENLYLLNRGDEAAKAYTEFIKSHKEHPNVFAAQMRISQIHHNAKRWDQALASAKPLLAKKPEGKLFAQLSFLVGDCFFRQEKWKDSIQPLEDFVNQRVEIKKNDKKRKVTVGPNLDTALVQLAVAYDRAGNAEKALGHLLTLVDHYPSVTPHLPLALSSEGRLAYQTGDLKRSRKALERFLKEDLEKKEPFKNTAPGQRPQVNYYLGWVNATENKLVEAAERFSKVPHNDPLGPDAAFQHGIALIKAENFEVAVKHFPEMLKQFKEHEKLPLIMYYAGLSATKQEDWGTASNYFKQVTDNHPKSELADHALYEWAWAERARKRNKEATGLYEKLLASHPKSPLVVKVQSEMAELNIDVGAQEKVIEGLTSILKTVKDASRKEDIRIQLASAHYKKGDFELAAGMFEQLLTDYPKSKLRGSMLFQAGESRFRIKEIIAARDHFAAASKISGLDDTLTETVVMRLGETQALTGQNKEAVKTYQDFLKRFGESKWQRNAQFGLGFALENSNKPSEAINEYRKLYLDFKKVDLWTVRGRFQTGECYFNDKKYEQAIAEFVNIEINFNKYRSWQAKSVLEIGRVLLAQDNRGEAIQRLRDVINRYGKEKAAIVARQYLDELGDPPPTPVTLADTTGTETEDKADKGTEADTAGTDTEDKTDKGPEAPVVEEQFSIFQLGAVVVVIGGILWGLSFMRRRVTSSSPPSNKQKKIPKIQ